MPEDEVTNVLLLPCMSTPCMQSMEQHMSMMAGLCDSALLLLLQVLLDGCQKVFQRPAL